MRNTLRRTLAAVMLFALLLPAGFAAHAADDAQINLESANPSGDVLQLIFFSDAAEAPSLESLKISMDGAPVALESVNPIDYADPGTSYLVLFDTNTAVTERALPDMQTIAKGIVNALGISDNALIVPVGQAIDPKAFSDVKEELNDSIDALTRGNEKTDLYSSISDAVKLLENDETLRPRRCLVVMADGLDNTADGISALEVSTQVSQCHVPLYLVALTYNTQTAQRIEAAKDISGIARLSPGGVSILLKNDGVSTADAVETILAQRAHTYLAVVKSEAVRAVVSGDKAEITLTQTVAGTELRTTRQVSIAGLPAAPAASTPEVTPEPTQTPLPTPTEVPEKQGIVISSNLLLFSAIAAGVAVVASTIVIIAAKKRRKAEINSAVAHFAPQAAPKQAPKPENPVICIVRLGEKEEIVYEGALNQPILLGEGEKSPILPNTAAEQAKTRLVWRDGTVWAMQNGEGVLVNGKQARTNACLNVGDVLRVNEADYRIFYSAD